MHYQVRLRAGTLLIRTRREDLPLETLLEFASRQNPKRGFLFVSKVLGKHIPCRPARMRQVYERLAESLQDLPGPVVVIGMAETATALGGGVAHSLAQGGRQGAVLYLHTTRHALNTPLLLTFDENHSHAPEHLLYAPQGGRAALFEAARSLVLVDDEISTGRTLRLLAEGVAAHLPNLRRIVLTSIVNWLEPARRRALAGSLGREVRFASLVEGEFDFRPAPDYRPRLPAAGDIRRPGRQARPDTGRTGLMMPDDSQRLPRGPVPEGPLVVVGTGEFAFAPFLAAESLERQGRDVVFQSTTRSPILEGEAIHRKLVFADEYHEGITNYLYNLPPDRQVIVAYEQAALAQRHALPALVNAQVWSLS